MKKTYTIIGGVNGFVHVADYRNGQLTTTGEYSPEWLDELKERLR